MSKVRNAVFLQITSNMWETSYDNTSGNINIYEKIIELPSGYNIDSILSPQEVRIKPTRLTNKGLNPFAFNENDSPVSLITLIGDSDDRAMC